MSNDNAVPVPTPAVGPPDLPSLVVPTSPDPSSQVIATVSPSAPESSAAPLPEAGKGGEAGVPEVTNAEFVAAIFRDVPDGAQVAVCSKAGDPGQGGWYAQSANDVDGQCPPGNNNYINCSTFYPDNDGNLNARNEKSAAFHALMLDDVGTKVPGERLDDIEPTWRIETSPGNYQVGIALTEPLSDAAKATELQQAIIEAGLCDPGAGGLNRWARLPVGINGKAKHLDANGQPFRSRLADLSPEKRYTVEQILALLKVKLGSGKKARKACQAIRAVLDPETVLFPKAPESPVIVALKNAGMYKTPLGSGKHDITCPRVHEHTDGVDNGTVYFEPNDSYPKGGFRCHHSHGDHLHIHDLLTHLGVLTTDARHKATCISWSTRPRSSLPRLVGTSRQAV
jgi:RepB DNA-primase from phage plasmid